jgi:protein gp37
MDFADNQVPTRWRDDAWHRIDQTRHLDWMLLSKRPENYLKMLPRKDTGAPDWGDGWQNVWVGTTIEDRDRLRRIDHLRAVPARIRFLSIEPLLEDLGTIDLSGIHLVIVGGESGPRARPMHPDWARSLRDQCASNNVPFFFKQWGEWRPSGAWIDGALEPGSHGVSLTGDVARAGDLMCGNVSGDEWNGYAIIRRVGKVRAGRLLDSREFSGMPDAR